MMNSIIVYSELSILRHLLLLTGLSTASNCNVVAKGIKLNKALRYLADGILYSLNPDKAS